ncbi:MAG: hypothetical protein RDV48_09205 [Candidatus Eremiobacteraeota bacterium]|nr:hypothetical protein [Candidatus Eremiobacteraeota bacterium]
MTKRFTAIALLAVCAFIVMFAGQAWAQDEKLFHTPADTHRYNVYHYPTGQSYFYLPHEFETKFDSNNGKFFQIEYNEFFCDPLINLEIYFYTPNNTLFGKVRVRQAYKSFCVPHTNNTLLYDNIKVKIRNYSGHNKDFKFVIFDPKEPVKGVPIPPAKDC